MKTIEERAVDFGEKHYLTNVESERTSAEDGYITGATEYRAIYIEKSCESFCKFANCMNRELCEDRRATLKDGFRCEAYKAFRKEMEEQE